MKPLSLSNPERTQTSGEEELKSKTWELGYKSHRDPDSRIIWFLISPRDSNISMFATKSFHALKWRFNDLSCES